MTAIVDVFEASLSCEVTTIARAAYTYLASTLPQSSSQFISSPGITTEKSRSMFALKLPSCPDTFYLSWTGFRTFAYNGCACGDVRPANIDRFVAIWGDTDGYGVFTPSLGLACVPSYSIRKASVTLNKTTNGPLMPFVSFLGSAEAAQQSTSLDGVTPWEILTEFVRTTVESRSPISQSMDGLVDMVISRGLAGDRQAALSKLFSLVTAQVANRNLKAAAQTSLIGMTVAKEDRLVVSSVSFWLLESMLLLLCLMAGNLILLSPKIVIPCDTSTIASLATVLARSKSAIAMLEGMGPVSKKQLARLLQNVEFRTNTVTADDGKPVFRIESTTSEDAGLLLSEARHGPEKPAAGKRRLPSGCWLLGWKPKVTRLVLAPLRGARNLFRGPAPPFYRKKKEPSPGAYEEGRYKPFTVTVAGQVLILLALSALIITLELLYRRSKRDGWLVEVGDESSSSTAHYAWRYIPTAVMVGMSLWLGALSSTVKLLSPYYSLWRGKAPAGKSITENYLTSVAIVGVWQAMRNRKWGVAMAGAASMLASSLTVVVSGLLLAEPSVTSTPLNFKLVDSFNLSLADQSAGLRFANFVLASNLSDPP
jgi:hypothetical protein